MVKRDAFAWALYDWANSAFATTVMAGFFPVFFKEFWNQGVPATVSSFRLGAANSLAGIVVAALAPVLGAIADRGGSRKRFLLFFAALGVVMTGGLYLVAAGRWQSAVLLYILAVLGFSGGEVFYDSLLVGVAGERRVDFVSALGYALGYLGGGILFALNVWMTMRPATFGLPDAASAVRLSFLTVSAWWAVFSVPVFLFVREPDTRDRQEGLRAVGAGLRQLARTFREIRKMRVVLLFLAGYWIYIDGVDTIIRMAVDYGLSLGFESRHLVGALLLTQFVGFPSAIAFGRLGERIGPKRGIYIALAVYLGVTVYGLFLRRPADFYVLAVVIGLVQGGIQSLSRSFYTRLIPAGKSAEFFGFYNVMGKFATVIGPALMGWTSLVLGNPRISILSISLLFILGGFLLAMVDEREGRRAAGELEAV